MSTAWIRKTLGTQSTSIIEAAYGGTSRSFLPIRPRAGPRGSSPFHFVAGHRCLGAVPHSDDLAAFNIAGIKPASETVSVNIEMKAGWVIDLTPEPGELDGAKVIESKSIDTKPAAEN